MAQVLSELRSLEGQYVCVAVVDGSCLDDCQLVSVGAGPAGSLWLVDDGHDVFVPLCEVMDVWPRRPFRGGRAA